MTERCTNMWIRRRCERPAGHASDNPKDIEAWCCSGDTVWWRDDRSCHSSTSHRCCSRDESGAKCTRVTEYSYNRCKESHRYDAVGSFEEDERQRVASEARDFANALERVRWTPFEVSLWSDSFKGAWAGKPETLSAHAASAVALAAVCDFRSIAVPYSYEHDDTRRAAAGLLHERMRELIVADATRAAEKERRW